MSDDGAQGGLLLRAARSLARWMVPHPLWPVIQEELQDELSKFQGPRWRREVWVGWQYLSVGLRVGAESLPAFSRATLDAWGTDFRHGVRSLRRRPLTTMSVAATIAVAVGATTAVYSVVDGVLLRPLPYPDSDRLARIWQTRAAWGSVPDAEFRSLDNRLSPLAPSYLEWLEGDLGFESMGAYIDAAFVLQRDDGATAIRGQEASSGLFEALGVAPALGRRLSPEDDAVDATPVVVVSHAFWRDILGGRGTAIGEDLRLNGTPHVVIGVMPADFEAPPAASHDASLPGESPLVWTPLTEEARRGWNNVSVLGRLAPGVALRTASDRLASAQDGMTPIYPDYRGAWAEDLLASVVGSVRATLWFLLGAVGLVLIVATVNIANLLTALGLGRQRELAVRASLGAGAGRLARGLLVESALLAGIGGAGGLLLAWIGLPLLTRFVPATLPRHGSITMSASVFAVGLILSAGAALAMGILPAMLASRTHPQDALRHSTRSQTSSRAAKVVRNGLVVAEVSLAFVLLIGAGLLGQSYLRMWSVDRGFETDGLVALWVAPDDEHYGTEEEEDAFARDLAARLGEIAGVRATAANNLPLSGGRSNTTFMAERADGRVDRVDSGVLTVALGNYFDVVGIPIVAGRVFSRDDGSDGPRVAVVSQKTADRFWPGENALGQRLRTFDDSTASLQVIGVVQNVRHRGLESDVEPTVYLPGSQSTRSTHEAILRVNGNVADAVQAAREAVTRLSPTTPVRRVVILDQAVAESVAIPRFRTALILGLASLAASLALLGIYGVVSHTVAQNVKEIGVRLALGARSGSEVRRVLGGGFKLGLLGAVTGAIMAWTLSDVVRAFLYETTPTDPATYLLVGLAVVFVTALAALLPARRAAAVEPVAVLRSE